MDSDKLAVFNDSNSDVMIGVECVNTTKTPTNYINIKSSESGMIPSPNVSSINLYINNEDGSTVWRGTVPTGIILTYDGENLFHGKTLIPDLLMPLGEMNNTGCVSYKRWWLLIVGVVVLLGIIMYYTI